MLDKVNQKALEKRTKYPKLGSPQWKKQILAAIASGKCKYTLPKKQDDTPFTIDPDSDIAEAQSFLFNHLVTK